MNQSSPHRKKARRLQAWQLKPEGWSQRQIGAALGISEEAVSMEWLLAYTSKLNPGEGL